MDAQTGRHPLLATSPNHPFRRERLTYTDALQSHDASAVAKSCSAQMVTVRLTLLASIRRIGDAPHVDRIELRRGGEAAAKQEGRPFDRPFHSPPLA